MSEILFGKSKLSKQQPKFKVGDYVRINKTKHTFEKGYLPNWTQELFQISAVVKTQSPITYKIEDLDGELAVVLSTRKSYNLSRKNRFLKLNRS